LAEHPKVVLKELSPEEQDRVMAELRALADRSTGVENEADLRNLTDAVHHLVEETPALTAFLSSRERGVRTAQKQPTTRKVPFEYVDSRSPRTSEGRTEETYEEWQVQAHAIQIGNHVFDVRRKLKKALREYPEER
jgi:hypothetical protein